MEWGMFNRLLFLGLFVMLLSCSSGNNVPRSNSNDVYGILNYVADAPFNTYMSQLSSQGSSSFVLTSDLYPSFTNKIICNSLSETKYCDLNVSYVKANPNIFGNIPDSTSIPVAAGVRFKLLEYSTLAPPIRSSSTSGSSVNVSGLVVMPTDLNGNLLPADKIKGVLIYYHETIASKTGNPSGYGNDLKNPYDMNDMLLSFNIQYSMSSIYASNGYIVIAPDYIGNGFDFKNTHPYILSLNENALSGIYMLKALDTYLKTTFNFKLANINKPYLYISSYSEGGSYAIRASRLIQENYSNIINNTGLTLKKTFGISGAYDIVNTMLPFEFANVTDIFASTNPNYWLVSPSCQSSESPDCSFLSSSFAPIVSQVILSITKPLLSTFLINALIFYNFTPAAYPYIFSSSFYNQNSCLDLTTLNFNNLTTFKYDNCSNLFGNNYKLSDLYGNSGLSFTNITAQIFSSALASGYIIGNANNLLEVFSNLSNNISYNSISSFIYPQGRNDPNFLNILKDSDNYSFTTNSPITLINLKYDSVVTPLNTKKVCNLFQGVQGIQAKPGDLECLEIDNTKLWSDFSLNGLSITVYMLHEQAAPLSQMIVLNKIIND